MKRIFPNIGDIVVLVLLFLVVQLGVGIVLGLFGVTPPNIASTDSVDAVQYMEQQESLGLYTAFVYFVLMVASLIVMGLYVRLRGGRRAIKIRHSVSGIDPNMLILGVVWLLASQIILEPLVELLPESESPGVGRGLWAWVTIAVAAPVLEELLCRGLLYEIVRKRWGMGLAIPFSALFFGVIHADISTMVVAIVAGVILAMIYERTSSIFSTMIIHSLNNIMAFSLVCFGLDEMSFRELLGGGMVYYITYAAAALLFVAIAAGMVVKLHKKSKQNDIK
jgi:membrane protease YdiL (CAAX protease family)